MLNKNNSKLIQLALFFHKKGHIYFLKRKRSIILNLFFKCINFFFIRLILFGEIPYETKIGDNLRLPHGFNGVILNKNAVIGKNVTLYHQVTIGSNDPKVEGKKFGVPVIENNVIIGAGAKIIGPIIIGENSRIAPNSLVRENIPSNSIVYSETKIKIKR